MNLPGSNLSVTNFPGWARGEGQNSAQEGKATGGATPDLAEGVDGLVLSEPSLELHPSIRSIRGSFETIH